MSKEVRGVPLSTFVEPIYDALQTYAEQSNGGIEFYAQDATKLELTPDKPNSARSTTDVRHLGNVAGKLVVIAFAPEDGTGDEKTYNLEHINTGKYPIAAKIVPRSKAAIYSEVHLTIAAQHLDFPDEDPALFAGSLSLLGLRGKDLALLGELGQNALLFTAATLGINDAEPTATLTVGYDQKTGDRFADPHSVFNSHSRIIQVCGFISLSHEVASQHTSMFDRLHAVQPELVRQNRF